MSGPSPILRGSKQHDLFALTAERLVYDDAVEITLMSLAEHGPKHEHWAMAWSGGHVKIGYTRNPPENRLSYLQIGSAERLSLVASFKGSLALEKQLHAHFDDLRTGGEWFREEGVLAAWIASGCRVRVDPAEDDGRAA